MSRSGGRNVDLMHKYATTTSICRMLGMKTRNIVLVLITDPLPGLGRTEATLRENHPGFLPFFARPGYRAKRRLLERILSD